jgi:two-component sensor histidine kinase
VVTGFKSLFSGIRVELQVGKNEIGLDLDRAIHAGLIVNELVTNAIKRAFPAGQPGEVTVAFRTLGDQVQLQVRDNGRGLPAAPDLEQAKSVGLRTVHILARRLAAQVTVTGNGGTSFTLTFPLHADLPVEPKLDDA